jgi:ATP-dependent Clp protease, protease subunit
MTKMNLPPVMALDRPGVAGMPRDRKFSAFTKPEILLRHADEAGGYRMNAAAPSAGIVVEVYEDIGEDWWTGGGVTLKGVEAQLKANRGQPVEVRINSGGGDMFEGFAIYNVLREHDADVTVKVIGKAASAASIIAMAGQRIEIGAVASIMIHNCWCGLIGNQYDFRDYADWLAGFDAQMVAAYAERSGQDQAQIADWMRGDTWMSGQVAIDRGFADALLPADMIVKDEAAAATARAGAKIAAMEHALMAGGMSRADARAHIAAVKGKPDAAQDAMPDAGAATDWLASAANLLTNLKS